MWYTLIMPNKQVKLKQTLRPGFTFAETLITSAFFALLILVGTLLLSVERMRTRDAIRIGHMTRVAGSFAQLYAEEASYISAATGCSKIGQRVDTCTFPGNVASVAEVADPGKFSYRVTRVPDGENFAVEFFLERGYGSYAAGKHLLTKRGIQ
jgi:hypothetical protein